MDNKPFLATDCAATSAISECIAVFIARVLVGTKGASRYHTHRLIGTKRVDGELEG